MTIRKAHGRAKQLGAVVVVETLPADELPAPVPAPSGAAPARNANGTVRQGAGTREMGRRGGLAKAESQRLARLMGLAEAPEGTRDYVRVATEWRDQHIRTLAESTGGGVVTPDVAALVSGAARAMAASLMLHDAALHAEGKEARELFAQATRQSEAQKGMLLAAFELCARAAKSRPVANPHAAVFETFGGSK